MKSLGAIGPEARNLFKDIAWCIRATTQDPSSHQCLFQRIAVAVCMHRGREGKVECSLCGAECESIVHVL